MADRLLGEAPLSFRLFQSMTSAIVRAARLVQSSSGWHAHALAFFGGSFGVLAMAPFFFWPALFVSFAIAIWLLDGAAFHRQPLRISALRGLSFGFGYFLFGLYWVAYAFMVDPDAHAWLLPFVAVIFPGGMALFFGVAFLAIQSLQPRGFMRPAAFALVISLSEWTRGHIFTGFPWNLYGYTWSGSPMMMQSASLMGIYGLSFLTLIAMAAPAASVTRHGDWSGWGAVRGGLTAVLILTALSLFGLWRLPGSPSPVFEDVSVRIVQPNVPQAEKWRRDLLIRNWQRLVSLSTDTDAGGRATHIIWPEAAPPFLLAEQPEALSVIAELIGDGALLLTGSIQRDSKDGAKSYNGAFAVDTNGKLVAEYAKAHLVPFGEYLPFMDWLEPLGITKLTGGRGGYSPGPGVKTLGLPHGPPAGLLICYEIIFPGAVTDPVNRPRWLVNMTDDSWFGPSTGPYQHLGIARVRAVEEGLAIVRAANTGVSAVIDPYGRIVHSKGLNQAGVVQGPVPANIVEPMYVRWGDVIYFSLVAGLGGLIAGALSGAWDYFKRAIMGLKPRNRDKNLSGTATKLREKS